MPASPRAVPHVIRFAAAPFLILAAPFAAYLQHHRYSVLQPEALLVLAAFGGVALVLALVGSRSRLAEIAILATLLTWFVDVQAPDLGAKMLGLILIAIAAVLWLLQQHAARLVGVAMATMCVVALVPQTSAPGRPVAQQGNRDLPFVLHVVLDEHLGVAGIPADLTSSPVARELADAFVGRGFRLFGAAYSEFPDTKWSLPHLLNLKTGEYRSDLARPGTVEDTYAMTKNAYFATLAKSGYAIRVYQPDYIDVCADAVPAAACHTYLARSLEGVAHIDAPPMTKLRVLAGAYFYRSEGYRRTRSLYGDVRRQLVRSWPLPAWDWERGSTAPIGSFPLFDRVAADLSSATRGQMVFAHFLLPHYPYIYDAQCRPRPIATWLQRSSSLRAEAEAKDGAINTPASRAERYRLYFEQLACTRTRLARLLDAIPASVRDDAVVLVHGDHGSRINLTDPVTTAEARLAASDYADSYSTLFAVRAPGIAAGYEPAPRAISCLLTALVDGRLRALDTSRPCAADGRVFLRHETTPRARPLRAFWQPDAAAPHQTAATAADVAPPVR